MYVFPSHPARPGLPCKGEDRSIYRRGARRWRKLYHVNGHLYQAKRFSRVILSIKHFHSFNSIPLYFIESHLCLLF